MIEVTALRLLSVKQRTKNGLPSRADTNESLLIAIGHELLGCLRNVIRGQAFVLAFSTQAPQTLLCILYHIDCCVCRKDSTLILDQIGCIDRVRVCLMFECCPCRKENNLILLDGNARSQSCWGARCWTGSYVQVDGESQERRSARAG